MAMTLVNATMIMAMKLQQNLPSFEKYHARILSCQHLEYNVSEDFNQIFGVDF